MKVNNHNSKIKGILFLGFKSILIARFDKSVLITSWSRKSESKLVIILRYMFCISGLY